VESWLGWSTWCVGYSRRSSPCLGLEPNMIEIDENMRKAKHQRCIRALTVAAAAFGSFLPSAAHAQVIDELYVMQDDRLFWVNEDDSDDYDQIGDPEWTDVTAFTGNGNRSFWATQDDHLYALDSAGNVDELTAGWDGPVELTYGWDGSTPKLYAVQDDKLWKVNPTTGTASQLGTEGWANATSMVYFNIDLSASTNDLFIVQGSALWRANTTTGVSTQLGSAGAWPGETSMTTSGSDLYIVQGSYLHRVNPSTGAYTVLGGAVWSGTTSMTSLSGMLYIIQNDYLHEVSPATGSYSVLGDPLWGGPTFMSYYREVIH
jgi:hypothetical protein